jgi:hypothetical protein
MNYKLMLRNLCTGEKLCGMLRNISMNLKTCKITNYESNVVQKSI